MVRTQRLHGGTGRLCTRLNYVRERHKLPDIGRNDSGVPGEMVMFHFAQANRGNVNRWKRAGWRVTLSTRDLRTEYRRALCVFAVHPIRSSQWYFRLLSANRTPLKYCSVYIVCSRSRSGFIRTINAKRIREKNRETRYQIFTCFDKSYLCSAAFQTTDEIEQILIEFPVNTSGVWYKRKIHVCRGYDFKRILSANRNLQ